MSPTATCTLPAWTRSSWRGDSTVVFSSTDAANHTSIAGVALESASPVSYAIKPGFFVRWSPDGASVAVIAGAYPNSNLYVYSGDGVTTLKII